MLTLQRALVERRQREEIPDTLLLVEHPPVITVGRRTGSAANVLRPEFPIVEIERGGDVTYHGPGQLVGYPILALREHERDLHAYLRALEEGLITLARELGIDGQRRPQLTGMWVGARKLASIGIAVRRWVTLHGFALNVSTNLSHFQTLRPCGLDAEVMTSLEAELGRAVPMAPIKERAAAHLGAALQRRFVTQSAPAPSSL
jgi:lipoyl(octanoyl) transferase